MALRVIAGSAGGIPLRSPRGSEVRPTMEQVKAAIFSSLAESVSGSRILDLYAGVGSLGIEALSRSADAAVFVEKNRRTADCIRENLEKTRLASQAEVLCLDVATAIKRLLETQRFELIFADPPYTSDDQIHGEAEALYMNKDLPLLLAEGGIFILEKSPRHTLPPNANGWEVVRRKKYGTTEVLFLKRAIAS